MSKLKWGIVSTGNIAESFTDSLQYVEGAIIEAVASRSIEKAKAFAQKHGIKKYYGSYCDMSKDKDIDIAYIATPHSSHMDNSIMFMDESINVLCEKPLGINAKQVEKMIAKAKQRNVFFMEGMWTRFFPAVKKGIEWVHDGSIGEPKTLFANFGIDATKEKNTWRFKREMAGGALMDVGIYPLAFVFAVFGTDYSRITSSAHVENGIDEHNTFTLEYPDGKIAVLSSGATSIMDNKAVIGGTKGCVKIGKRHGWWRADIAELLLKGNSMSAFNGKVEVFEQSYSSTGFQYEAKAVQDYVLGGYKQSREISWDDSLKIAQTIDLLRKEWGVVYDED